MRLFILALATFALFTLSILPVSANHVRDVLGDTTIPSDIEFPQIGSGPGYFLPDSPLYFLDNLSQQVKVFFAFSPERKAQIRSQIAGERLAELRVMLEENNQEGINRALENFIKESDLAAGALSDAGVRSGSDIRPLAKELNATLKEHRKILKELERQSSGELRLRFKTARQALQRAKAEVVDELPAEDLDRELQEDLDELIADEVEEASRSARGLNHAIDVLERLASQAAEKNQTAREAALRRAIEKKNENLLRQEERRLERDELKEQKRLERNIRAIEEGKEAARRAVDAAQRFDLKYKEANDADAIEKEVEEELSDRGNSGSNISNSNKNSSKN